jgi:hypothetical protein
MQNNRNQTPAPSSSAVINLSTPRTGNGLSSPESLVSQFLQLREQMLQREQALTAELAQIGAALKDLASPPPTSAPPPPAPASGQRTGLTAAVVAVLAQGPRTKEQVVQALLAQGFPLPANPRSALDPILYNRKRFQREGKLFRLLPKTS